MDRRQFLSAAPLAPAFLRGAASAQRPNILYIHSHDTGRYTQPYGHAVPTPNLQKLAEQGVLFKRAYSAAPTCSPSRSALVTGQCPHSNGMLGLAHRGFRLNDYRQHLVHTLKNAGYFTALAGVQHVASHENVGMIGYDRILTPKTHAPDVAAAAVEFLKSQPKQPFLLTAGFFETHRDYPPPGPTEDERYCMPPRPIPDAPETRHDMAQFKASARIMDAAVGQVLTALERAGVADDTLVISTTDHGISFPTMKCNLTDDGIGVMMTLRGPGGFSGGKVCDAMVSHMDIFPTLCDLLNIEHPSWLQGRSLLPLMRGTANSLHEELFAEVNYHAAYEPKRCVRTERWKYIRHFDDRTHPNLPNCDDGPSKSLWLKNGWREQMVTREGLFDLMFDPAERHNLMNDSAHAAVARKMQGRLERWMQATNDPLLRGPVKAPHGAKANDPDGTSPREAPKILS